MPSFVELSCGSTSAAAAEIKTCKVTVEPNLLRLEGSREGIYTALRHIAATDSAVIDKLVKSSGDFTDKSVNNVLREDKIERFKSMLQEALGKIDVQACPINCAGYMPYPHNTRTTTSAHQVKDVSLIVKCIDFQGKNKLVCRYCHTASLQRALKERGE